MYKILVADDERWIRKGIVRMIDRERFDIGEIYEADSVQAALEIVKTESPHIVLSDVMFPTENGCDLGEAIFALNSSIKIVMISAYDDFQNAKRAIRFRAMDYLLKPVSKEQLNEIIGQCIEQIELQNAEVNSIEVQGQYTQEENSEKWIRDVMDKIRTDCGKHYVLAEMAEECHLTETYFSALFKRIAGKSPMNFLLQTRIEKACEFILATDLKMVQIARNVGYSDYQYFTKVFKKVIGETPGEYKTRVRQEITNEENRQDI